MPLAQIEAYKARMGWTMPFVSSQGTTSGDDCGASDGFMLSVFLRDGEGVYRTYCTTARDVDRLLFVNDILAGRSIPRTERCRGIPRTDG
jgi:predicted dithiol-disulfide oxidoreductase (DUF899 family)